MPLPHSKSEPLHSIRLTPSPPAPASTVSKAEDDNEDEDEKIRKERAVVFVETDNNGNVRTPESGGSGEASRESDTLVGGSNAENELDHELHSPEVQDWATRVEGSGDRLQQPSAPS